MSHPEMALVLKKDKNLVARPATVLPGPVDKKTDSPSANVKNGSWLMQIRFLVLIFILFMAVFAGFQRWLYTTSRFGLNQMVMNDMNYLSQKDILNEIAVAPGTNIFRISLNGIEKRLRQFPRVKSVKAARQIPDKIVINVQERNTVALVKIVERFYEVDDAGVIMPEIQKNIVPDFPIITGLKTNNLQPGDQITDTNLNIAINLINKMETIEPGWSLDISEIAFDDNKIKIFSLIPGQVIQVSSDNYSTQLERYKVVLEQIGRDIDLIKKFDLRFNNQVIVEQKLIN